MTPVVLLPLVVVIAVLALRRHMLEAGLLGAIVAMLLGRIGIPQAVDVVMKAIPGMLGTLTPIFYSSAAIVVAKNGGFENLLNLLRRLIGNRMPIVAAAVVLIQGLATYAAGLGAGNTMVTAPLALAAVGAVPEMIAGMAIATAAGFETSPGSAESTLASRLSGTAVAQYADMMRPFTLLFWGLAMLLAAWGVWRRGRMLTSEAAAAVDEPTGKLLRLSLPPLYLIAAVVAGTALNRALGWHLFTPLFNVLTTLLLVAICVPRSGEKLAEGLGGGLMRSSGLPTLGLHRRLAGGKTGSPEARRLRTPFVQGLGMPFATLHFARDPALDLLHGHCRPWLLSGRRFRRPPQWSDR